MGLFGDIAPFLGGAAGFALGGPMGGLIGAGIGTSVSSAQGQAEAQQQANETNVNMAREQMAFQERMSNSAYQRAMGDMQKAGLNPMLAFSQGGASAPSGQSATVAPVNEKAAEGALGQSAMNAIAMKTDLDSKQASTDLAHDQAFKVVADRKLADTNNELAKGRVEEQQHRIVEAEASAQQAVMERERQSARQKVDVKMAPIDAGLERVEQAAGAVTSGLGVGRAARGLGGSKGKRIQDFGRGGEMIRERHIEDLE